MIDGLVATGNRSGLVCDATTAYNVPLNLRLRNAVLLENRTFGAFVGARTGFASCVADLGTNAAANNQYNRASRVNGVLGLCYQATQAASASASTWGCGLATNAACTPASTTPAPVVVSACDQVGDYNQSASLAVALPQTCCGQ
jgi:hypothetical protein